MSSLFYDPFAHKVYDYSDGIADLTAMKVLFYSTIELSVCHLTSFLMFGVGLIAGS